MPPATRPPRRDAADTNAADTLPGGGEALTGRVPRGPLLVVRVSATPAPPRAGQTVHLQAAVDGPAAPGRTFAWTFGDGAGAGGAAVTHRFREPGIYAVTATVTGSDDSGGSSDPLVVRVGRPLRASGPPGGGRAPRRRAPAQGKATGERAPAQAPAHAPARRARPDRAPAPAPDRRRAPASATRAPAPARAPARRRPGGRGGGAAGGGARGAPPAGAGRPRRPATPPRAAGSSRVKPTAPPKTRPPAGDARRRATSPERRRETRRAPPAPPP